MKERGDATTGTAEPMAGGGTDPETEAFLAHRNLLGSAADAEDVLQETWLRWVKVDVGQLRGDRGRRRLRTHPREAVPPAGAHSSTAYEHNPVPPHGAARHGPDARVARCAVARPRRAAAVMFATVPELVR
ncbi:hypothetical protein ACFOY2_40890 [Nonomuraea purpurea]|uniref:RNA polymerase sigma-70 region 2 domain-containing protein n=1 Tax=Nonomuraea purpurea TaxID=1849276 RepID=A0ABV8GL37_9ACTN